MGEAETPHANPHDPCEAIGTSRRTDLEPSPPEPTTGRNDGGETNRQDQTTPHISEEEDRQHHPKPLECQNPP